MLAQSAFKKINNIAHCISILLMVFQMKGSRGERKSFSRFNFFTQISIS